MYFDLPFCKKNNFDFVHVCRLSFSLSLSKHTHFYLTLSLFLSLSLQTHSLLPNSFSLSLSLSLQNVRKSSSQHLVLCFLRFLLFLRRREGQNTYAHLDYPALDAIKRQLFKMA